MNNNFSTSDRNSPPSKRQLLTLLGLFLGTIFLIIWVISAILNNLVWLIPINVEQQLGKVIVPTYEKLAKPSSTQDTLNQLLTKLENNITPKENNRNWQVLYIPEKTVNAIAIPGDRIIIYQGLLNKVQSENELMMVLGHELGHFAHRDHLRGIVRQLGLQIVLSMILGNTGGLESSAINVIQVISNAKFSQEQETKADEFGLELLNKNYGHVGGATDFFVELSKIKGLNLEILSTHPHPETRVKQLENLIKQRHYQIRNKTPLLPELKS